MVVCNCCDLCDCCNGVIGKLDGLMGSMLLVGGGRGWFMVVCKEVKGWYIGESV